MDGRSGSRVSASESVVFGLKIDSKVIWVFFLEHTCINSSKYIRRALCNKCHK